MMLHSWYIQWLTHHCQFKSKIIHQLYFSSFINRTPLSRSEPAFIAPWWSTPPKRWCVSVIFPCLLIIQITCTTPSCCSTSGSMLSTLTCSNTSISRWFQFKQSGAIVVSSLQVEVINVCVCLCECGHACFRPQSGVSHQRRISLCRVSGT